jgi:hypothetical protein
MENNFFTVKLLDIIVPIDNVNEDFDTIFLVMDYIPMTLEQLLAKD